MLYFTECKTNLTLEIKQLTAHYFDHKTFNLEIQNRFLCYPTKASRLLCFMDIINTQS